MLKKEVQDILNKQIAMEEYASRSYLNMALWADQNGYDGAAKFLYAQSAEEQGHMKKIIKYLLEADGQPVISDYGEKLPEVGSFKEVFETGLSHEQAVTKAIHKIVELAWNQKDYATFNFMQWYVAEQVEEEDQFRTILDKIEIIEKQGGSLYMLDRELGARASK